MSESPFRHTGFFARLLAILLGLLGCVVGIHLLTVLYMPLQAVALRVAPNQTIMPSAQQLVAATTVDFTEDAKAMGYPDGRKIVRDSNGDLYVAYRKKFKLRYVTAYHIFVARSTDNGQTWSVTNGGMPIEAVGDINQRVPAIAIDRHNVLHVVWYGEDEVNNIRQSSGHQIKYARSDNGGKSWSAWRNIAYVAGFPGQGLWQEHPVIYIAPGRRTGEDVLYVAWEGYDSTYRHRGQIKFTRSTDGGNRWQQWRNIAPLPVNHSRPTIVGTAQGKLYLLAYGRVQQRQQIIYSQSNDYGQSWSRWQAIAPAHVEQRHVSATIDRDGLLHVAWRQPNPLRWPWQPQHTQIYHAQHDGRSWSWATPIHPNASTSQTYPSISTDGSGTLWLAWSETPRETRQPGDMLQNGTIYYSVRRAGQWSLPTAIAASQAETDHNSYVSLARPVGNLASAHESSTANSPTNDSSAATGSIDNGSIDVVWLHSGQFAKTIQFAQLLATDRSPATKPQAKRTAKILPAKSNWHLQSPILLSLATVTTAAVLAQPHVGHTSMASIIDTLWPQTASREAQALIFILSIAIFYIAMKLLVANRMERKRAAAEES